MKKRKKLKKSVIVVLVLIFIVVGAFVGRKIYKKINTHEVKVVDTIDDFSYTLDDRDTELYKTNFNELKSVLKADTVDYDAYAKVVAKLFVIDLFTISNKTNKYDIPSEEFVYPDAIENFAINVGDTLYKYVSDNTDNKRAQELPTVSSIEVDKFETGKFSVGEEKYDSYVVKLSWEYEKDLGYDKEATVTLIKDKDMVYVVEYGVK